MLFKKKEPMIGAHIPIRLFDDDITTEALSRTHLGSHFRLHASALIVTHHDDTLPPNACHFTIDCLIQEGLIEIHPEGSTLFVVRLLSHGKFSCFFFTLLDIMLIGWTVNAWFGFILS